MKLADETRTDAYYAVHVHASGYVPDAIRRYETWQAAYADAKRTIATTDATLVQVIRRTLDAYIYRGVRQFTRENN
jgi:hypothetical protein